MSKNKHHSSALDLDRDASSPDAGMRNEEQGSGFSPAGTSEEARAAGSEGGAKIGSLNVENITEGAKGIVRNLRDRASNAGGKITDFAGSMDVDGTIGRYPKSFVIVGFLAGAILGASLVTLTKRS